MKRNTANFAFTGTSVPESLAGGAAVRGRMSCKPWQTKFRLSRAVRQSARRRSLKCLHLLECCNRFLPRSSQCTDVYVRPGQLVNPSTPLGDVLVARIGTDTEYTQSELSGASADFRIRNGNRTSDARSIGIARRKTAERRKRRHSAVCQLHDRSVRLRYGYNRLVRRIAECRTVKRQDVVDIGVARYDVRIDVPRA